MLYTFSHSLILHLCFHLSGGWLLFSTGQAFGSFKFNTENEGCTFRKDLYQQIQSFMSIKAHTYNIVKHFKVMLVINKAIKHMFTVSDRTFMPCSFFFPYINTVNSPIPQNHSTKMHFQHTALGIDAYISLLKRYSSLPPRSMIYLPIG